MQVPLSNIAFTIPWVMGSETEKLTTFSLLGLVIVLLGFCWYMQTTILKVCVWVCAPDLLSMSHVI